MARSRVSSPRVPGGAVRTRKGSRSRVTPPEFPDGLPRLFYWYDDFDPAQYMGVLPKMQQSSNPQHRTIADSAASLVAHLQQGRIQASYKGDAHCRICGQKLGSSDLTNTFVAWPEGTEHYITAHGVWTPQHSWLAAVVMGRIDPRAKPPPAMTSTWNDSGAWRTRIPGLSSEPPETPRGSESREGQGASPPSPQSPSEKMAMRVARGMAKIWEAGDFEEFFAYLFRLLPLDMRTDMVEVIRQVDASVLPRIESQENTSSLAGFRPMTREEMWDVAVSEATSSLQRGE